MNQSGYENPLNMAAQPTEMSIKYEHRKSQEKSKAYPEIGMNSTKEVKSLNWEKETKFQQPNIKFKL
jgi:hypothetical protein